MGQAYYDSYSDHLFNVVSSLFSKDYNYYFSISKFDKCVFKWKVTYNEEKLKALEEGS